MTKALFDTIRAIKGSALSQADVDAINLALGLHGEIGVPVIPEPPTPPKASTDIPDDYWPMLAKIESGNRPYVKASTSSASGLYQFIRGTWEGEGGKWGSKNGAAFGGLTPSVEEQLSRAKSFTEKNASYLRKKGIPINKASLYAAHFLGASTAAAVIGADVKANVRQIVGDAAATANPSILGAGSVAGFLTWLHKKTGCWAR